MSLLDFLKNDAAAPAEDNNSTPVAAEDPKAKAAAARDLLSRHMGWIDANMTDPVEKARAVVHAFSTHIDNLDPDEDRELIDAGRNLFKTYNPHYGDENESE